MPRENAEAKGRRYVTEGRLLVEHADVDLDFVRARCRGNGAVYVLGHDLRRGGWHCDCPARGRCAHLVAVQLVTVARRRESG